MPDRILVLLPDGRALALEPEVYRNALSEGSKLAGPPAVTGAVTIEPLVDADQLAELLQVPASWLETAGRAGRVPSVQCGRWRRYSASEVVAALRRSRDPQ